jgi:predicted TIM-barrel fold metal-dependent hydrolase
MIDAHIHVVPPNLPGVGPLSSGLRASVENVARVVREQMLAGGFTHALAMGSFETTSTDALGIERTLAIAEYIPGLYAIGAANPQRTDSEHLQRAEAQIQAGKVVALKAYLGYVHCYPNDPGYVPYYQLAEKYKLPFFFHTGDTYSPYAKLKYAQPIHIDEVAVDFPKVSFIMAHVGNPWMIEAAEVVYKNMNVWVDLSGLIVGDESDLINTDDARADVIARVQAAFRYAGRPNRFLYGSDWPLAPMPAYRDFIRAAIPEDFHDMVFDENARVLFGQRIKANEAVNVSERN